MLRKKYVVQKSFRIDSQLENDLGELSFKLGRPQNDLVNYAIELLMQENRMWFAENILVDKLFPFFESARESWEVEVGDVYAEIHSNDDNTITCYGHVTNDKGDTIKQWDEVFEDNEDGFNKAKESLRRIAVSYLVNNDEVIENYLRERLDYR